MKGIKEAKIDQLIPDDRNLNKHTEYGMHLLEKSISELGIGRSIVVDKNNRIIGGNGVVETVANLGIEDIIIVPTDGNKLVVVKRTDIDINSKKGRELCLADNATSKANLSWDEENIARVQEQWEIDPADWGVSTSFDEDEEPDEDEAKEISTRLVVECSDVTKLSILYSELQERGFKVELKE